MISFSDQLRIQFLRVFFVLKPIAPFLQKAKWWVAGSLKVFLEGSGVLNRYEYSFYIDGPPPGPLLYCTQEQYSSLMNPPEVSLTNFNSEDKIPWSVERLYWKRPIQCLASSKILTPTPHRPASVYPQLWCGGRTHSLGGEGVGGQYFVSARHSSVLYICKYFVACAMEACAFVFRRIVKAMKRIAYLICLKHIVHTSGLCNVVLGFRAVKTDVISYRLCCID